MGAHATPFDGTSKTDYKPWKELFQREVTGLDLSAHQWLDILRTRTTGEAKAALHPILVIEKEVSAEVALEEPGGLSTRDTGRRFDHRSN